MNAFCASVHKSTLADNREALTCWHDVEPFVDKSARSVAWLLGGCASYGSDLNGCAVQDNVNFDLKPGGQLDLSTTLCYESRLARLPIVIDDLHVHPIYRGHYTSSIYGLRSYISVPTLLPDGTDFGNLCAIDPKPASVSNSRTLAMFESFANLIPFKLSNNDRQQTIEEALSQEREVASLREQFIAVLNMISAILCRL